MNTHQEMITRSIHYIDRHLDEHLSIIDIAKHCALSPRYFQKVFSNYTGLSVGEYLRKRRLTTAANRLVMTNERIIDIAFSCNFTSHEAFTRAFKAYFKITPTRYRLQYQSFIQKKEVANMEMPKGWTIGGNQPSKYKIGVDSRVVNTGKASGFIKSIEDTEKREFGTLAQAIKAEEFKNQRVRLSGFIKTEDLSDWAGLWLWIDSAEGEILKYDNMEKRPIKGTTNWNQYSIVLDVPEYAFAISYGILLFGQGKVWIDGLKFDIVDRSIPETYIVETKKDEEYLLDTPINLNFEE